MIKIVTIIGARPQIIKAAALSRAIKNNFSDKIKEVIVHTGQHYDDNMSQVFFDELGIPSPDYNLGVGSGKHGAQTAKMIEGIEEILIKENINDLKIQVYDVYVKIQEAWSINKIDNAILCYEVLVQQFSKSTCHLR